MTCYRKYLLMPALVRLMWSSLMWMVGLQSAVVLTANVPRNLVTRLLRRRFSVFLIQRRINYFPKSMTDTTPPPIPDPWQEDGSTASRLFSIPAATTQQCLLSGERPHLSSARSSFNLNLEMKATSGASGARFHSTRCHSEDERKRVE